MLDKSELEDILKLIVKITPFFKKKKKATKRDFIKIEESKQTTRRRKAGSFDLAQWKSTCHQA